MINKHPLNPFALECGIKKESAAEIVAAHRNGKMTSISALSTILKCLDAEDKLTSQLMETMHVELDYIAAKLGVDRTCAVLLSVILERSCGMENCHIDDICSAVGCNSIEFLSMKCSLEKMLKLRMIKVPKMCGNGSFIVSDNLMHAIESDSVYIPQKIEGLDTDEFFALVHDEIYNVVTDVSKISNALDNIWELINLNQHLHFCRQCNQFHDMLISHYELLTFFYICQRYANFSEDIIEIERLEKFCKGNEGNAFLRRISREKCTFQNIGYYEFATQDGMKDTSAITLTEMARAEFMEGIEFVKIESDVNPDIFISTSIKAKPLFYNPVEGELVERLHGLLDDGMFKGIQDRLEDKGMRKGFCYIFYGAPGTGKTASVYELARRSGRDIFSVDVSQIKSKWVGGSEKAIKGVFDRYRKMCSKREKAPILLFNEADAIFSRRKDNPDSSVDKMNNSIQNIILQGMEDLDGILIATTNLEGSLDPAFERRFLYKIKFDLPSVDSRSKMWKSMIPELADDDCTTLAKEFQFSGGQIENIARKNAVEYILYGTSPTIDTIRGFCGQELMAGKHKRGRIGF